MAAGLLRGSARPASASPAPSAAGLVDGRVLAAARKGGVRLCLIAILAAKALNRQVPPVTRSCTRFLPCHPCDQAVLKAVLATHAMLLQGVEQALAEVARRLPGFKVSGDIQTSLRNVATYQSPGRYLLHKHLLRELDGLSADELHADDSTGIRAGSPVSKAAKQPTAEQAQQGPEPASGGKRRSQQIAAQTQAPAQPAKRHRLAAAAVADEAVAGPAVEAPQLAHAAHAQAAPGPADSPPVVPAQPQPASQQRSATPCSEVLPAAAAPQQPAKLPERHRPVSASPTPTPSPSVRAGSGRLGSSGRLDSSGGRGRSAHLAVNHERQAQRNHHGRVIMLHPNTLYIPIHPCAAFDIGPLPLQWRPSWWQHHESVVISIRRVLVRNAHRSKPCHCIPHHIARSGEDNGAANKLAAGEHPVASVMHVNSFGLRSSSTAGR